jgi:tRNA G46 methylase TrmB
MFDAKDVELILVAGLLHDYDPAQANAFNKGSPKGPNVTRTIEEIKRTRITDAFFTMNPEELENYFREFKSALTPPTEFAATHPEYVKTDWSPKESEIVEALIWRTDFPFMKQKVAQEMFARLLTKLVSKGEDADKIKMFAEILWLADLAVTYMGSDPIRAWDRVTNLYDELNLPKLEAVPRTDAFFADFAENESFKQIINMKHFPYVFRQRWNLIYQFFHEGNPSTQLNRTISTARKMYFRVNLLIGLRKGEMLQAIADDNYTEYFIGIDHDQDEVFRAKSKFIELEPQNASAFWGDIDKLLPAINNRSIDNFLMVLPEHECIFVIGEGKSAFKSMLATISKKLLQGGTLRILTDLENNSSTFRDFVLVASQEGFKQVKNTGKSYFPKNWRDYDFKPGRIPWIIVLELK